MKKQVLSCLLGLGLISSGFAAPKQLVTHNYTNVESNAFIDGSIASQHPTKPNSVNKVFWASVKIACYGHVSNNLCKALIKMDTDSEHPVELGWVNLNLTTGEITPSVIYGNGYRLEVNGPGETSLYINE